MRLSYLLLYAFSGNYFEERKSQSLNRKIVCYIFIIIQSEYAMATDKVLTSSTRMLRDCVRMEQKIRGEIIR